LLDGIEAQIYYSDASAGNHLVNPSNGKRFSDDKIYGTYNTNVANSKCVYSKGTGGYSSADGLRWVSESICGAFDNGDCGGGLEGYVSVSYCNSRIGSYWIYATGWH